MHLLFDTTTNRRNKRKIWSFKHGKIRIFKRNNRNSFRSFRDRRVVSL